jgi:hypothetical protein
MNGIKRIAAAAALSVTLFGLGTGVASADTPGICTAHKANTATWGNCHSNDGKAHWVRLYTACKQIGGSTRTTVTKWRKLEAGGDLTISGNCRIKAVDATMEWRPY